MTNIKEIIAILQDMLNAAGILAEGIGKLITLCESETDKPIAETTPAVKTIEKKQVTLEEVRTKLANLSRNDHTAEVKALLRKYGAEKLSLIKPEDYEAILNDAKEIENA